jgi:hypothetical protein
MSLYDLGDVAKLQLSTFDSADAPADATDVSLAITKPDGTVTTVALAGLTHTPSSGIYGYSLPLTMIGPHVPITWAATGANQAADIRRLDVYGATICDPSELRARYADVASTATYPDSRVREALRGAVEQWNTLAGVSMAPFARRITRLGNGRPVMALPNARIRSVVSLKIDGITVAPSQYYVDPTTSQLTLTSGSFTVGKQVVVHYTHGLDSPPRAVVDAVMQRAIELLIPPQSGLGRMTSVANDLGYSRLSLAGRDGSTGVPDFDATAALFGVKRGKRVGSTITSPYGFA